MKCSNKAILIVVIVILIFPGFTRSKTTIPVSRAASQESHPILFLHGRTENAGVWGSMRYWFTTDGWPISSLYAYTFPNTSDDSIATNTNNANLINQWVQQILTETGAEKVDLVSHSMGGLSGRYYIKFFEGINHVDDYVSLGCPHHSISWKKTGVYQQNNTFLWSLNNGDETPGGVLNDTIGERIDPVYGFNYNSTHIPGNLTYTSIYSQDDEVVMPRSAALDGAKNIRLTTRGLFHEKLLVDTSVYELVRAAVDDSPATTPTPTLTTSTVPATTTTPIPATSTVPATTTTPPTTPEYGGVVSRVLVFLSILIGVMANLILHKRSK